MATPARSKLFLLLLLAVMASSFTLKNRFNPESQHREETRKKAKAALAHDEAKSLQDEILQKRMDAFRAKLSENRTIDNTTYPWEAEVESEWSTPFVLPEDWADLPHNQRYSMSWFKQFNASYAQYLLQRGSNLTFAFALSTGHCGTTTMSESSAYSDLGYDPSSCHWGFETLAQGTRDFFRHHPGRAAAHAFTTQYYLPSVIEMTLAAGKKCFVDFGHHTLFGHFGSALKDSLRERLTMVRLRRERLHTATSYGKIDS